MKKIEFFISSADINNKNGQDFKEFTNWCRYFKYDLFINETDFIVDEKSMERLNIDLSNIISEDDFLFKLKKSSGKIKVLIQNKESGLEKNADFIFASKNTELKDKNIPVQKVFIINNFSAAREILSNLEFLN
ncbi:MAG: hypothetical protein WC002_04500 [Candidatus Muiribacteriota bacterium]